VRKPAQKERNPQKLAEGGRHTRGDSGATLSLLMVDSGLMCTSWDEGSIKGIKISTSAPGSALLIRNSPPNSIALCFIPLIPTPRLSGGEGGNVIFDAFAVVSHRNS
jgi:hypothetical protein